MPVGSITGGGVGCHGMIHFEARHEGETFVPPTPMGAEGAHWIGLAPFVGDRHLFQNLGDGTFSHSGSLAIRACVAAGVHITFKLLYNSAVAMTGGQDVTGLMDVPALTRSLAAEGVSAIAVCTDDVDRYGRHANFAPGVSVRPREDVVAVQEELRGRPGVSVLIYDQRCAAEARRLRKRGLLDEPPRRVVINQAVCEGCGDCSRVSNCLSVLPVETEFGEKREIHQSSCNKDYSCLEGDCPSFVTLVPAERRGIRRWVRRRRRPTGAGASGPRQATRPQLPRGDLPLPAQAAVRERFSIYTTGIGGTGVVTANRLLARAAVIAGYAVQGRRPDGAVAEGRRGRLAPAPRARRRRHHDRHGRRRRRPTSTSRATSCRPRRRPTCARWRRGAPWRSSTPSSCPRPRCCRPTGRSTSPGWRRR